MIRKSWIALLALLVLVVAASWLWWVKPKKVDMAAYAPADSLLYLEANNPSEIIQAITGTDAWITFERAMGTSAPAARTRWLQGFVGWTGIGPIQSVILARAQVAAVVTDLGTAEEGDTLRIRPEGAILIETHTAESRIRPPFEQALKTLAEKTYGRPTSKRVTLDGFEFSEWIAPDGFRQIVGTIIGSLVIIGNTEYAVQNCLAVSLHRRPSLKDDAELDRMRHQLAGEHLLTFGYVPPKNSAKLMAVGLPLLLGRAPGDSEFQRLITNGAAKVFGSLGWTSRAYLTGVEDRYSITLQPAIVVRLKPNFESIGSAPRLERVLPEDFYSVTSYRFAAPAATWQGLKSAVSSQVDILSTIIFSSLLKSALLSYGIEDPETFLGVVNGELLTVRLDESADRSLLIAGVKDRAALRALVAKKMRPNARTDLATQTETFEDPAGEFAASFINDLIVIGTPTDVRHYVETKQTTASILNAEKLERMTLFVSSSNSSIVTYTDDSDRVRSFISSILSAKGSAPAAPQRIEEALADLPYSVTETTLSDRGIERITRSPLGQFSTLLPLLLPEQPGVTKTGAEPK